MAHEPLTFRFADDGETPNNPVLPLVLYRGAVDVSGADPAAAFEKAFAAHGWVDGWRNGIFDFLHFHTRTHEVLGIARGHARVQFGGDSREEVDAAAERMLKGIHESEHDPQVAFLDDPRHEDELWQVREAGLGATAHVPGRPDTFEGWEDSAVHPDRLGLVEPEGVTGERSASSKHLNLVNEIDGSIEDIYNTSR